MIPSTIFLIGFMGAGKSTLGEKLAPMLGLQFADLDRLVAQRYGLAKVQLVIEQKGIEVFRKAESETLKSIELPGKLIATGGGTPCFRDNLAWMQERGLLIYVQLDETTLYHRLKQTNLQERPLLRGLDDAQLKEFIRYTLREREGCYERAHITYHPLKQTLAQLIAEIEQYKIR